MDIFDRIASDFKKEARISKGDKKSQNEEAQTKNYAEWLENLKEKNPKGYAEWTKYEGAFDPSTGKMNPDRIKKNEGENKGSGGEDISALGQMGKKKASRATWQSSLYSVDGNPPESGFQILHDNDNDPEVEEILMEVFRTGRPVWASTWLLFLSLRRQVKPVALLSTMTMRSLTTSVLTASPLSFFFRDRGRG